MKLNIAVLAGDGIGPEVTQQAIKALTAVAVECNHQFYFKPADVGAIAIDKTGDPLPNQTLELCKNTDAILFGSIGHPKYDNDPKAKVRPEQGLLALRKSLGLYANIRPVKAYETLLDKSPLKKEIISGTDILMFRELTGGIYFGQKELSSDGNTASDLCVYHSDEIERITHLAFKAAMNRGKKVTLVDKANVLESSRLWRRVVQEIATEYPEVKLEVLFVDNAAMQIILNPSDFDVLLTENMFGDILSDEAAMLTGSIGMLPSASLGADGPGLFEPVHGSAPDIAGQDKANPMAMVLSAAMMLRIGLKEDAAATELERSVDQVLASGFRTGDLMAEGCTPVGCEAMGAELIKALGA